MPSINHALWIIHYRAIHEAIQSSGHTSEIQMPSKNDIQKIQSIGLYRSAN